MGIKRLAAIGDVHGCLFQLKELIQKIKDFYNDDDTFFIFLGDIIDRGPYSVETVRYVKEMVESGKAVCIRGNHEDMYLSGKPYDDSVILGEEEIRFLKSLPEHYETTNHYFVHAGVDPLTSLNEQKTSSKMWIRDKFLNWRFPFEKHIVHGHTPESCDLPVLHEYRSNLDTSVCFNGRLTAAIFEKSLRKPVYIFQVNGLEI
jgi:serine/threonine protein phosphatase 1